MGFLIAIGIIFFSIWGIYKIVVFVFKSIKNLFSINSYKYKNEELAREMESLLQTIRNYEMEIKLLKGRNETIYNLETEIERLNETRDQDEYKTYRIEFLESVLEDIKETILPYENKKDFFLKKIKIKENNIDIVFGNNNYRYEIDSLKIRNKESEKYIKELQKEIEKHNIKTIKSKVAERDINAFLEEDFLEKELKKSLKNNKLSLKDFNPK